MTFHSSLLSQHRNHLSTMASSSKLLVSSALRAAAHLNSSKIPSELVKSSAAFLSSAPSGGKVTLPDLPYDYGALEPVISAETMELHHSKHHNTYVTNLNVALEKLDVAVSSGDVSGMIALHGALKFNGGGHLNHSLFWENLAPGGGELKDGPLKDLIMECYGDFDVMKNDLNTVTVAVQGSGWGWLGYNPKSGGIESKTCANQDPLQATTGLVPLMGIDVWEHAYYVDYRNLRPKYVEAIWNIINWDTVEKRLLAAQATA